MSQYETGNPKVDSICYLLDILTAIGLRSAIDDHLEKSVGRYFVDAYMSRYNDRL